MGSERGIQTAFIREKRSGRGFFCQATGLSSRVRRQSPSFTDLPVEKIGRQWDRLIKLSSRRWEGAPALRSGFEIRMLLREFTEPAAELLEKYAGLKLDPMWSDAVVGTSLLLFAAFALKGSYLWIRRTFFNDIRALPEDQLAMVNIIAQDVNGIKHDLQRVQESLSASVTTHFDKVVDEIKINFNDNEPTPHQPVPQPNRAAQTPTGTKLRKLVALRVRDAVMEKFVEGGWFREDPKTRHTYIFRKTSYTHAQFEITLETPYRDPKQRGAYALHIRVDGRKKLNLEWRAGSEPALRYLSAGDWVEVITLWKFAGPRRAPPLAAAAE